MADRRMFAKSVVLSDFFLSMPATARCLYFTLSMLADDDGFVDAPRAIMRQCNCSEDDMGILFAKKYLLAFDTGVIVIRHWRLNNYLRSDRYKETIYLREKEELVLEENNAYEKRGVLTVSTKKTGTTAMTKESEEGTGKSEKKKCPLREEDSKKREKAAADLADLKDVKNAYTMNYLKLLQEGVVKTETPINDWDRSVTMIKARLKKYGRDIVLQAIERSIEDDFCVRNGYVLTTILATKVFAKLINGNVERRDVGSSAARRTRVDVVNKDTEILF